MIKYPEGTLITESLVTAIIEHFKNNYIPGFLELEKYYRVKNKIMERVMKDSSKPNNKLPHGFAKYITNMATSYFIGEGIKYKATDEKFLTELNVVFDKNNNDNVNYEVSKENSKKGISFELLYTDEAAQIRYKNFKAEDVIPVYSTSVNQFLLFAIRIYSVTDLVTEEVDEYAVVYTKDEIISYMKIEDTYVESERTTHEFEDVPVLVYWNNEEIKGDYEDIIQLVDAYDKAQSDTANDFEYFTDAYLLIKGASEVVDEDDDNADGLKTLKEQRIMFAPENGGAEWLIKTINDTAIENFKDRLYNDVFFLSQVPALTDESFSGNLTGVAIRYKLIGLEQLASTKGNKFTPAEKKKVKMITTIINKLKNTSYDPSTIEIVYSHNMIDNELEQIQKAQDVEGIVTKKTQISILPKSIVDDPEVEYQNLLIEQKENLDNLDLTK